ncbi:TetR/AcrR family transcriptional regulator [Lactiplantibacillus herbarum]|uniref:TetR/AcrR family transcriptional regulator n=1 Tax=Lactiplantibacillus herbarum TaxID=1670446 RepID=UPI000B2799A7
MSFLEQKGIRDYFEQTVAADQTLTDKQRAILQASLELFAEQGFDHTSTSDIAQKAGVAEGTVYRRYKTKEALREAVIAPIIDHIFPSLAADFSRDELQTKYERLEDFFRAVFSDRFSFVNDNLQELKVLMEMVFFTSDGRQAVMAHVAPGVVQQMMATLDDLKARHLMVDWPNDLIIQTMLSLLVGYFARTTLELPGTETQRQLDFVVQLLTKTFSPALTEQ